MYKVRCLSADPVFSHGCVVQMGRVQYLKYPSAALGGFGVLKKTLEAPCPTQY